ncbi:unnamed protein product [Moneuplotes crassus]|uniref:Uncharacterized protein n=2 Tax=Euplotes crassus TaxID=5936 RepID=A0AAD1U8X3_EUPCR|nr:unnamed protein product [Moneuplotes crassus]
MSEIPSQIRREEEKSQEMEDDSNIYYCCEESGEGEEEELSHFQQRIYDACKSSEDYVNDLHTDSSSEQRKYIRFKMGFRQIFTTFMQDLRDTGNDQSNFWDEDLIVSETEHFWNEFEKLFTNLKAAPSDGFASEIIYGDSEQEKSFLSKVPSSSNPTSYIYREDERNEITLNKIALFKNNYLLHDYPFLIAKRAPSLVAEVQESFHHMILCDKNFSSCFFNCVDETRDRRRSDLPKGSSLRSLKRTEVLQVRTKKYSDQRQVNILLSYPCIISLCHSMIDYKSNPKVSLVSSKTCREINRSQRKFVKNITKKGLGHLFNLIHSDFDINEDNCFRDDIEIKIGKFLLWQLKSELERDYFCKGWGQEMRNGLKYLLKTSQNDEIISKYQDFVIIIGAKTLRNFKQNQPHHLLKNPEPIDDGAMSCDDFPSYSVRQPIEESKQNFLASTERQTPCRFLRGFGTQDPSSKFTTEIYSEMNEYLDEFANLKSSLLSSVEQLDICILSSKFNTKRFVNKLNSVLNKKNNKYLEELLCDINSGQGIFAANQLVIYLTELIFKRSMRAKYDEFVGRILDMNNLDCIKQPFSLSSTAIFGLFHLMIDTENDFKRWTKAGKEKAKDKVWEYIFPPFTDLSKYLESGNGIYESDIFYEVIGFKEQFEKNKIIKKYQIDSSKLNVVFVRIQNLYNNLMFASIIHFYQKLRDMNKKNNEEIEVVEPKIEEKMVLFPSDTSKIIQFKSKKFEVNEHAYLCCQNYILGAQGLCIPSYQFHNISECFKDTSLKGKFGVIVQCLMLKSRSTDLQNPDQKNTFKECKAYRPMYLCKF